MHTKSSKQQTNYNEQEFHYLPLATSKAKILPRANGARRITESPVLTQI